MRATKRVLIPTQDFSIHQIHEMNMKRLVTPVASRRATKDHSYPHPSDLVIHNCLVRTRRGYIAVRQILWFYQTKASNWNLSKYIKFLDDGTIITNTGYGSDENPYLFLCTCGRCNDTSALEKSKLIDVEQYKQKIAKFVKLSASFLQKYGFAF